MGGAKGEEGGEEIEEERLLDLVWGEHGQEKKEEDREREREKNKKVSTEEADEIKSKGGDCPMMMDPLSLLGWSCPSFASPI